MATDIDYNHAAFVQEEYRYAIVSDVSVVGNNPNARDVTIETTLDAAGALAIANKVMALGKTPRVFQVVLQGTWFPDSMVGSPLAFAPQFPKLATDGRTMKVIAKSVDYGSDLTTFTIRG